MSFWPRDTAGQIADVTSALAFLASIGAAVYARLRGNTTDKAVRELRQDFARRELLPDTARRYQALYLELAPLFSQPSDLQLVAQKLGEFRGMINSLDSYFDKAEKETLKPSRARLDLIAREPDKKEYLLELLGDAAALSVELDEIVKRITWNNPS